MIVETFGNGNFKSVSAPIATDTKRIDDDEQCSRSNLLSKEWSEARCTQCYTQGSMDITFGVSQVSPFNSELMSNTTIIDEIKPCDCCHHNNQNRRRTFPNPFTRL